MFSSKGKSTIIFVGKVIFIALLIVLLLRCFVIESFTVSSAQMFPSLHPGDKVFVDKTSYGIRMPITIVSLPFTRECYSSAVELPYKRLFESKPSIGDVVLYNNPQETDKPLDKRSLQIGRCSVLPGDTVKINNSTLFYEFAVPKSGMKIDLNSNNLNIYRQAILSEQPTAYVELDQLYISGELQQSYIFMEDYYWILSENANDSIDSRLFGFIPKPNIIGKVKYIWYSSSDGKSFSSVK